MEYIEWSDLKIVEDKDNPFSTLFVYPSGESFYIEGTFYTQLTNLKSMCPSRFDEVLDLMKNIVLQNKKVIFTMDFLNPVTHKDGYIYTEIEDICNALGIYVEDKSRGSDYGD